MQRLRVLLSFVLIIGIAYFCYWALKLPQWYINSEKLAKASSAVLKIQGNIITPDYKIINMVRQTQLPYTQIFRLDTTELENNISQLNPIKKVYVRRYWFPARLVINVDERTPAFLLAPNLESEPNSALTTDGLLIDHDYLPLNPSIKTKKLLTYGVKDGFDEVWDKFDKIPQTATSPFLSYPVSYQIPFSSASKTRSSSPTLHAWAKQPWDAPGFRPS